jgi:hypothetical protein
MERGPKSAEAYRATALLCRQQAAYDPDNSWRLLGEAERWEDLAERILASRRQGRAAEGGTSTEDPKSALEAALPKLAPSHPKTMAARPHALPSKPNVLP